MEIKVRKPKAGKKILHQITIVDPLTSGLSAGKIFKVSMDDVTDNNDLEEPGTLINQNVIDTINWREDQSLEFNKRSDDTLPNATDKTQIVTTIDGDTYVIPPNTTTKAAVKIGDTSKILKSTGKTHVEGDTLEYYNKDKELKMFSARTRIGARNPKTYEGEELVNNATYLEIKKAGTMEAYFNGNRKIEIDPNMMIFQNKNSIFQLKEDGVAEIYGSKNIRISSPNTLINESANKFNCNTELDQASYGNNSLRLQFFPNHMQVTTPYKEGTLLKVDKEGNITTNGGTSTVIDTSNITNYLTDYVKREELDNNGSGNSVQAYDWVTVENLSIMESYCQEYIQVSSFLEQMAFADVNYKARAIVSIDGEIRIHNGQGSILYSGCLDGESDILIFEETLNNGWNILLYNRVNGQNIEKLPTLYWPYLFLEDATIKNTICQWKVGRY